MRTLHPFHGGLRLPGHKRESTTRAVDEAPLPRRLYIPLHQHIGEASEPLVETGAEVLKGQMIAKAHGYLSVPVHAPTSGRIAGIIDHPVPHASGLKAPVIVIDSDGQDAWVERRPVADFARLDPSELRNRIRNAGIVGLGGAAFPSFIKANPGPKRRIDTLVINGAECEPYITCDDMLMRERAHEIIAGALIVRHAVGAREILIAIEDNKQEAIASMRAEIGERRDLEIVEVPTLYPTGSEKQLIQILTGKEVPSHGLPADIRILCHNVATVAAIHRAIDHGEPLISRLVTVTGSGVAQPRNLEVLIGTPMGELIEHCGGYTPGVRQLVMGGPMMGFTVHNDISPVIKATNCLLAATDTDIPAPRPAMPCIRCSRCAEACPASLLPQQLYWHARARSLDAIQEYDLFDCIECGCCAYVCPSHIPLVQYYRYAKTEIWALEQEREKSDLARRRAEFRRQRIEREEQERAARLAQKKAALKKKNAGANQPAAAAGTAAEETGPSADA
jgi:electron transport complex protein RnfC